MMKYSLYFVLFVLSLQSFGQGCPFITPCHDPNIRDTYLYNPSDPYLVVKTIVHIIRETNGTNPAASDREVMMQMHHLNLNYAPYGIQFTYQLNYIDNSTIRTVTTANEIVNLMANNAIQTDSLCNIFVGSGPASLAFYPWLPQGKNGVFINSGLQFYPANNRASLTHEMGHSLGLYHTFTGYNELSCSSNCAENMNSMGDTVGDYCSDTPPQESNFGYGFTQTTDNCSGMPFSPIPHTNFMSYSDNKRVFTPQQVARMHCYLTSDTTRSGWLDTTNPQIPYVFNDNYGYSYSTKVNVDTTQWVDITNSGVLVVGLLNDNVVGPFSLGFSYNYYGQNYNQIYIGSNGYISFANRQINAPMASIPSVDGQSGFLAPFLTDLNFSGSGNNAQVYFYTNGVDSSVISFENVPFYSPNSQGYSGLNTFQVVLQPDSVCFHYYNMDDYYPSNMHQNAKPSIIGIQSLNGQFGLEVNNYQIPNDHSSVTFKAPLTLGVVNNQLNTMGVNVFPNPTSGEVMIQIDNQEETEGKIYLYDIFGKEIGKIFDGKFTPNGYSFSWNTEKLAKGTYILKILIGTNVISKKLIVNN